MIHGRGSFRDRDRVAQFNKKIMRGSIQLFAGQLGVQLIRFVRNFILARLLVPDDFGVASTFAVTMTALELLSDLSLEKMIVRDPEGDNERFQATLTLLSMIRFALLAVLVFASAGWLADIYDVPEAKTAYQIFTIVPILRMFIHLDTFRVQREMNFNIEIYSNVASQVIGLIVAAIAAYILRDYTAVLWGVITQTIALVAITHAMATRPFRIAWETEYARRALIFGWPLVVNGLVLMLVSQADRVLVGAALGMTELAIYTIAVLLVTVAGSSLYKIISPISLPWLSAVHEDPGAFQARFIELGHVIGLITVVVFVPITLMGSDVVAFIFGEEYLGAVILIGLLSTGMAIKVMRSLYVNAFLASGQTRDLMLSETARVLGILLAALVLYLGGGLVWVGLATLSGELAAYLFCALRMRPTARTPVTVYAGCLAALGLALALLAFVPSGAIAHFLLASLLVALYVIWRVATVESLRAQALSLPGIARGYLNRAS